MRRVLLIAVVASALTLGGEAGASAATVTVGSPLTASFVSDSVDNSTQTNTALGETGANVTSPVTGVIVRWRVTQAGGPLTLRVLVPTGGGTYAGGGTSSPQTPTSTLTQTFATNLPIQAGQAIGIDLPASGGVIGVARVTGSAVGYWVPPLTDGSPPRAITPEATPNVEWGFNADVVPQPGVTSVTPASGSLAGGTSVVIRGHDFTGATAVRFGGAPATSFTVNSDSQITGIAPAGATTGPVDVTVTTQGGTSPTSAADGFTYTPPVRCVVPKLKGKTLGNARSLLSAAHCELGLVTKPKHHKGKLVVKSQSPGPNTTFPSGTPVSVKLGPKPHKKH